MKKSKHLKKLFIILLLIVAGIYALVLIFREKPQFTGNLNERVSVVRQDHGLPPLTQVEDLNVIAQMKCDDMVKRNYYAHKNPNGKQLWEQYNFGEYKWYGENLAQGYRTAYDTAEGWRKSPEHLKNIVNPEYKEVGYGVCVDENNYFLVVQAFRG